MSNITDEVVAKTDLKIVDEPSGHVLGQYHRFDDGSAEVEVLEFLYSLVRIVKPTRILETGTYFGLTAAYMALGLRDNAGEGLIDTIEWEKGHLEKADKLWGELQISSFISKHNMSSLDFESKETYQIVLLDTEPQTRLTELNKFWENIVPGGIIVIHDLSWDLGIGAPQFWLHKEILDSKIKNHELQVINFLTPRGITILQKFNPTYESFKLLTNE